MFTCGAFITPLASVLVLKESFLAGKGGPVDLVDSPSLWMAYVIILVVDDMDIDLRGFLRKFGNRPPFRRWKGLFQRYLWSMVRHELPRANSISPPVE
jgi:hypothetical protein